MSKTLILASLSTLYILGACKGAPQRPKYSNKDSAEFETGGPKVPEEKELAAQGIVPTATALGLKVASDSTAIPILSNKQFENAIRDVFLIDSNVTIIKNPLPLPNTTTTFFNDAGSMAVTDGLFSSYVSLLDELTTTIVGQSLYTKAIPSNAPAGDTLVRASAIVKPILTRAYRRAPTTAELALAAKIFFEAKTVMKDLKGDAAGFTALIPMVVLSPSFIYKTELGANPVSKISKLSASEVATRLASALWESVPDESLIAAAADGSLLKKDILSAQVERMLQSPKAKEALIDFNMDVFEASNFKEITRKDTATWGPKTLAALEAEARAFFDEVVNKEKKGLTEILTASYAFVTDATAKFYKVASPGDVPKKMDLDTSQRKGFYTQVGYLALRANDGGSLIIRRGGQVARNLVCKHSVEEDEPESPPPVDESKFKSAREAIASGTDACGAACHKPLMNPIGYSFENYDNAGIYRTKIKDVTIDAAATLTFSEGREVDFNNALEFVEGLSEKFETHRCYVSKIIQFVYGRRENMSDIQLINDLAKDSLAGAGTADLFKKAVLNEAMLQRPASK